MSKITVEVKNAIALSHDLNLTLSTLSNRINSGQELSEQELSIIPQLASYGPVILNALLNAITDPEDAEKVAAQQQEPQQQNRAQRRQAQKRKPAQEKGEG